MARYVSLLMDVEDAINDASDDAALRCAQILTDAGVTGSLCITGEKIRRLHRLGRMDVLSALRPHAWGLHTNTHSYHPTTMELLEDKGWEDGCEAFVADTALGVEAFRSVFGKSPSFWGGAGNTWGPQVAGGLPTVGIGAYVYSLPSPWMRRPYRFCGCTALPGGVGIGESNYEDEVRFVAAMDRVLRAVERARTPWMEVFIGHPTRIRHRDFWDVGFFGGVTPASPVFVEPYPEALYEAMLGRFGRAVRMIAEHCDLLTVPEVLALPWEFSPATEAQRRRTRREWPKALRGMAGWPPHKPTLDTTTIVAETLAKVETLEIGRLAGATGGPGD